MAEIDAAICGTPETKLSVMPVRESGLVCPAWLSPDGAAVWRGLVDQVHSAGVHLEAIDTHALAMLAYCLTAAAEWAKREQADELTLGTRLGISKLVQKYQAEAGVWIEKIGGTPNARARMGIKQAPQKSVGPLAELLARKRAMDAAAIPAPSAGHPDRGGSSTAGIGTSIRGGNRIE